MEHVFVQSNQIITPEIFLGLESLLQVYYQIFKNDCEKCLPPVLIVKESMLDVRINPEDECTRERLGMESVREYHKLLGKTFHDGAEYFLLDGNHRAVAAALCHKSLSSMIIETEKDIKTLRRLAQHGEIFNLPSVINHPFREISKDYKSAMIDYFQQCFSHNHSPQRILRGFSLKERVSYLARNDELPGYMKRRFLRY